MKKKIVYIAVFVVIAVLIAGFFLFLKLKENVSVFFDEKQISVSSTVNKNDEILISAKDIFDIAEIDFTCENGKAVAKGKKTLEIDSELKTVSIDGNETYTNFEIQKNDILIPPFLAAEVMAYNAVLTENEIHFIKPASLNFKFRESGKTLEMQYSDTFFKTSSTVYNHSLARLSIGLAVSAFSSKNSDKFWGNDGNFDRESDVTDFMNQIGFSDIQCINYDKSLNSSDDSAAFALGRKKISVQGTEKQLVAVSVRGGIYGNEWVSNLNLGNSQIHKGFLSASNDVLNKISKYVEDDIDNTIFWITGYSRGGAIAGIVAARLTDEYKIKKENIFTYTFGTPNQTTKDDASSEKYGNIFNIVSENDIVPNLPLSDWGFYRYGKDVFFPTLLDYDEKTALNLSEKVDTIYKSISNSGDFNLLETEKSGQKDYIISISDSISGAINSSAIYTDKYSAIIMDFIKCCNTKIQKNGNWKWASAYEGLALIYDNSDIAISKLRENSLFKNAENLLGETGEKLVVLGAICIIHGKNPYDIIVREIGIENLSVLASVMSYSNESFSVSKAHYPESYIAMLYAFANPALMRVS